MQVAPAQNAPTISGAPTVAPVEPREQHREIIQAVKAVNAAELLGADNQLTFSVDRDTHHWVIRIVNSQTNEVVRQVPPEYVLNLAKELERQEQ